MWDEITVSGRDTPLSFRTKEEMVEWMEREVEAWRWLDYRKEPVGPTALNANHFVGLLQLWRDGLGKLRVAQDASDGNYRNWVSTYLRAQTGNRLILSDTLEGQDIQTLRETAGIIPALWMYLFRVGTAPVQSATSLLDVQGLFLSAFPAMVGPEKYKIALQQERRSYREEVNRIGQLAKAQQHSREEEWGRRLRRARRLSRHLIDKTADRWQAHHRAFSDATQKTLSALQDTQNRYQQQMALAAPVQYWRTKSSDHRKAERTMLQIAALYFVAALCGLWFVASGAAKYILALPKDVDRAAVYVIVSGGLLAFTTMLFWIGRIVMKLYLSEHHLRVDAAERAVMTQTYLAMTEEGSATEAERAIVLSSIFRPTPDGIVKDEGPTDASLGGILSKLLTSK